MIAMLIRRARQRVCTLADPSEFLSDMLVDGPYLENLEGTTD
jgi:hypothetical protein